MKICDITFITKNIVKLESHLYYNVLDELNEMFNYLYSIYYHEVIWKILNGIGYTPYGEAVHEVG